MAIFILSDYIQRNVSVNPGSLPGVLLVVEGDVWCQIDFTFPPTLPSAQSSSHQCNAGGSNCLCKRLDAFKFKTVQGKHSLIRKVPQTSVKPEQQHAKPHPQPTQPDAGRGRTVDKGGGSSTLPKQRMLSQSPVRGSGKKRGSLMDPQPREVASSSSSAGRTSSSSSSSSSPKLLGGVAAAVSILALAVLLGGGDENNSNDGTSGVHFGKTASAGGVQHRDEDVGGDALLDRVNRATEASSSSGSSSGSSNNNDGVWHAWPPQAAKAAAMALTVHVPSSDGGGHDDPPQTEATVLMLVAGSAASGGAAAAAGVAMISAADASAAVQAVYDQYHATVVLDGRTPCHASDAQTNAATTTSSASPSAEERRTCIREAAAAFLADHPAGLIVLRNIREVPGLLTVFHRCWDAAGWLTPKDTASRVSCAQSTFVVELELSAAETASAGAGAGAGAAHLTAPQRYLASVRALKVVLNPIMVVSERKANEGEGKALLRRIAYWALLFPT